MRRNDDLFDRLDRLATFVLANFFWVLFALPIITLPLATVGLFATLSPWVRGKSVEVFRDFFAAMRQRSRNATLVMLINLLLGGLIIANFLIFRLMNASQVLTIASQSVNLFVALSTLTVNLYIWPLMVMFDLPLRILLDRSTRLALIHPAASLAILILASAPLIVSLFLPAAFFITVTFSTVALIVNWGTWRIIRPYLTPAELARLEAVDEDLLEPTESLAE